MLFLTPSGKLETNVFTSLSILTSNSPISMAIPNDVCNSSFNAVSLFNLRADNTKLYPFFAKISAQAFPNPELAPVINTYESIFLFFEIDRNESCLCLVMIEFQLLKMA